MYWHNTTLNFKDSPKEKTYPSDHYSEGQNIEMEKV